MLAKAIAYAPTRAEALRKLWGKSMADIHGPATNRDLLVRSLRRPGVRESPRMDTFGFYERHLAALTTSAPDPYAPLAAALSRTRGATPAPGSAAGATSRSPGQALRPGRHRARGALPAHRAGLTADGVRVVHANTRLVVLEVDGVRRKFEVTRYGDQVFVNTTALTALPRFPTPPHSRPPAPCWLPCPEPSSASQRDWPREPPYGPGSPSCGWRR